MRTARWASAVRLPPPRVRLALPRHCRQTRGGLSEPRRPRGAVVFRVVRARVASSVMIMGGGPVAVELAAEIIDVYPTKRVTLLSRSDRLCAALPEQLSERSQRWLERRDVDSYGEEAWRRLEPRAKPELRSESHDPPRYAADCVELRERGCGCPTAASFTRTSYTIAVAGSRIQAR